MIQYIVFLIMCFKRKKKKNNRQQCQEKHLANSLKTKINFTLFNFVLSKKKRIFQNYQKYMLNQKPMFILCLTQNFQEHGKKFPVA